MENKELSDIVSLNLLSKENASFYEKDGFLYIKYGGEDKRASLHRAFPFSMEREYISVLDTDKKEIGIIRNIDKDFDADSVEILTRELAQKYFSPIITKINGMKDNYGFMQVSADTDLGPMSFGVRDIYRSITKVGGGRIFIYDVDGNRYEVPSVDSLDRKSRKMLELYL